MVGQVVRPVGDSEHTNACVVFRVFSANADKVCDAALAGEGRSVVPRVMHLMDVLQASGCGYAEPPSTEELASRDIRPDKGPATPLTTCASADAPPQNSYVTATTPATGDRLRTIGLRLASPCSEVALTAPVTAHLEFTK